MFGPKCLEEFNSPLSGQIRVMQGWGYKYVSTGALTQSGGIVREVWEPVLKKVAKPNQTWLILGLAGGTIAQLISKKYKPKKITGVEIDPVMIDLGKRYFDLEKIPELNIVLADAKSYVINHNSYFDYVLVDMYFGDQLPQFVYDPKFLSQLKKLGQVVIFNHLFYDTPKKQGAENLISLLKPLFPNIKLFRRLTNLLIVCS